MANGFADDGTGPQTNTDSRPTNRPQTRTAVITGGTGGRPTSPAPKPVPKNVTIRPPKTIGDATIKVEPVPPAPPVVPPPAPIPTPPPPPPPPVPYNTPVSSLPGRKGLKQNPQRYKRSADGKSWSISATPAIAPVVLPDGEKPALRPVLEADGLVVKIRDFYLISPGTLADIQNSGNPHYDIAVNGSVMGKPMGKSVPIVELDINKLTELAAARDILNRNAGVKDVVYAHETPEQIDGLPKGVLDQINYVLNPTRTRPEDGFEVWGLNLKADYNITPIKIETAQGGGIFDKSKLATLLKEIKAKLVVMEEDLNNIKGIFYDGNPPVGSLSTNTFKQAATTENATEGASTMPRMVKTSQIVAVVDNAQAQAAKSAAGAITELSGSVATNTELTEITAGSVGTLPPKLVPSKENSLISKWQAWKLRPDEKDALKNPKYVGGVFTRGKSVTVDKEPIRIDLRDWTESICTKLRLLNDAEVAGLGNLFGTNIIATKARQRAVEYFGTGKSNREYIKLNDERKAEALLTASRIKAVELKTGKVY